MVVAYAAGGYGGELVVPGCDEALAFLHSGDNLGPPTVDDVLAAHADLRARHPEAEVRASTLDAFARAVAASGAGEDLPVVTSEIGDPWLFGAASDPQKVAAYRMLLDLQRRSGEEYTPGYLRPPDEVVPFDRALLLVAEHTWGLDQKIALPGDSGWAAEDLARLRSTPRGERFEASWDEQRTYVDRAAHLLWGFEGDEDLAPQRPLAMRSGIVTSLVDRWQTRGDGSMLPVDAAEPIRVGDWTITVDPGRGSLIGLVHGPSGRVLADPDHPLLAISHQTFDEADYDRFYAGLSPQSDDEWWARWDNTKPGIDRCGARSSTARPARAEILVGDASVVIRSVFAAEEVALGAPPVVWSEVTSTRVDEVDAFDLAVVWPDKPATRLPEATWCSFVPIVAEPDRWEIDKLGQRISPLDVVRRGGRSLHGVGQGMHYDGPDGRLTIATHTAPLVAPGRPNLLDADPPVPDLAGGWHVLLHDNCWGTNFPMWNEGPAVFSFTLSIA